MQMMRLLLLVFTISFTASLIAQDDICSDMTVNLDPDGNTVNILGSDMTTNDGSFVASGLGAGALDQYYWFTSGGVGTYSMDIIDGIAVGTGPYFLGVAPTCAGPFVEISMDAIVDGTVEFCSPTGNFILAIAADPGNEGDLDIDFSFTPFENDDCLDANQAAEGPLSIGANTVDNTCSSDGMVWHEYVVPNDATSHQITFSISSGTAAIGDIFYDDCSTPFVNGNCADPGSVLYVESGDNTPVYGSYDITVVDTSPDIAENTHLKVCPDDLGDLNTGTFILGDSSDNALWSTGGNQNDGGQISGGVAMTILYYTSQADAELGSVGGGGVITPYPIDVTTLDPGVPTSGGVAGILYARVEDNVPGGAQTDCWEIVQVTLEVVPPPVVTNTELTACETGFGTGMFTYELEDAESANGNANGQNTSAATDFVDDGIANATVVYYDDMANALADNGVGIITAPYTIDPTTLTTPNTIYAQVTDDDTGCFAVAEIALVVSEIPEAVQQANLGPYCNGEAVADILFDSDDPNGDGEVGFFWEDLATDGTISIGGTVTDSGTGDITGWVATNTTTAVVTATITVTPYTFGLDGVDDLGLGDDCIDPTNVMTFEIEVEPSPANDDCAAATDLNLTGGILLAETNACASLEAGEIVGSCNSGYNASVWYEYTVMDDVQDLTITVNQTGISTSSLTVYFDPNNPTTTDCTTLQTACISGIPSGDLVLPLADCFNEDDVLLIAVNSNLADAGTFDITVTEGAAPIDGDVCETAINGRYSINPNHHIMECNDVLTLESLPMTCPDIEADDSCVGMDDPGTWYYFDTTVDIAEIEIMSLGGNYQLFTTPNLSTSATPKDCSDITSVGCPTNFTTDYGNLGFFILVTGGDVQITSSNEPAPLNEDCASIDQSLLQGTTGVVNSNNICATGDANVTCNSGSYEMGHVVYFEFISDATLPQDITISLAGTGAIDEMTAGSITLFDDCTGSNANIVQYATDAGMDALECDGINNEVTLECVDPNTTFIIAIGSDGFHPVTGTGPRQAGEFNLTVTAEDAAPDNDLCANAVDVSDNTNWTNICASAEATDCTLDATSHDVWYTYTPAFLPIPSDITITVAADLANNTGITEFSSVVYDGTNGCALDDLDPCTPALEEFCDVIVSTGGDIVLNCVSTPILFYIGSLDGTEGDFTIAVTDNQAGYTNDECSTPDQLANGDVSNSCATFTDVAYCGLVAGDNDIWYSYTNTQTSNVDLEITLSGTTTISGTAATDISMIVLQDDCTTLYAAGSDTDYCNNMLAGPQVIDCIPVGSTIHIGFGSPNCMAGDFTIAFTETANGVDNDECSGLLPPADPNTSCVFQNFCTDNTNACPEDWTITGCGNTADDPTVFMELTIPADVTSIEVENITGPGTPSLVIMDELTDCTQVPNIISPCLQGMNGTNGTPVMVTAGSTYFVLVTSDMEGSICFDIKYNIPPDNDVCTALAEVLIVGTPIIGETTECASLDITGTCNTNAISTVWYTYTVPAGGHSELTVDVTNYVGAMTDDISVFALIGDCTSTTLWNQANGDPADYCGVSGTELLTFSCLLEGDQLTIAVASVPDNQGTFDIVLNDETDNPLYDAACIEGDFCTDLQNDHDVIVTNDPAECHTLCNSFACPDNEINTLCGGTVFNTVFYTFTTDIDNALTDGTSIFLDVNLLNSDIVDPLIMVLEGGCSGYTLAQSIDGDFGCFSPAGPIEVTGDLQPNTTYTVVVGTNDNVGGTADLCITISTGCVNDICDTSITLDENDVESSSTNNCTQDPVLYDCGNGGGEFATAWFTFEFPATGGFTGADVTTSNIMPAGTGYGIQAFDGGVSPGDCTAFTMPLDDGLECNADGLLELRCLIPGNTYYIMVGSQDTREIDFDIEVDFLLPGDIPAGQPGSAVNDLCDNPTIIDLTDFDTCEPMPFEFINIGACPDVIDVGTACDTDFGMDPTVWYEVTLPPTGYGILAEMLSPNSYISIFEDDCPVVTPLMGDNGDCVTNVAVEYLDLVGGSTFLIAMANPVEGIHSVTLTFYESPAGDDPNNSTPGIVEDDFIDLGQGGGSNSGTTCCAIGFNEDDTADFPFQDPCSGVNDDDGVWYLFTNNDPLVDEGYDVVVSFSGGAEGSSQVTLDTPDGEVLGSDCSGSGDVMAIPNCYPAGTEIWIKIGTRTCGEYTISVTPGSCGTSADACGDAETLQMFETLEDCSLAEVDIEVQGCLTYACPDATGFCGTDDNPTVWYEIPIDEAAAVLQTTVVGNGFDASWAIFTSCGGNILPGGTIDTPVNCGDELSVPIHSTGVNFDNQMSYWIAITSSSDITDGTFTLSYSTSIVCVSCSGESETDCTNNGEYILSIDSDGDGTFDELVANDGSGTICAGTEAEICFSLEYNTSQTGADWIHGLIPTFGPGWDLTNTDFISQTPAGFDWYPETDPCPPQVTETMPNLCTYVGDDGLLKLCNTECQVCPCSAPLLDNSPLPSGWFATTPSNECPNGSCVWEMWGLNGGSIYTFNFCIIAVVKTFDTVEECEQNKSLQISFQTTSDGVSGCYTDNIAECLVDPAAISPYYEVDCNIPPAPQADPTEICNKGTTNIPVSIETGEVYNIEVVFNPITNSNYNPNVSGGMDYSIPTGFDIIMDQLCLAPGITTPQTVIYEATVVDPDFICPGAVIEIEVLVYPDLLVDFDNLDDPEIICFNDSETFGPNILGGSSAGVTYLWSDGSTGSDVFLFNDGVAYPPGTIHTLCVVVTDDNLNCTGEACFNFDMRPELILEIQGDNELCLDCEDATDDDLVLTYVDLSNPQIAETNLVWDWSSPTGGNLANTVFNFNPGEFIVHDKLILPGINEITDAGLYEITLSGQDELGCEFITEPFELTTIEGPEITIDFIECTPTGSEYYVESQPITATSIDIIDKNDPTAPPIELFGSGYVVLQPGCYTIISDYSDIECLGQEELIVEAFTPVIIDAPDVCVGSDGMATVVNCGDYTSITWDLAGNTGCNYMLPALSGDVSFTITLTDADQCEGFAQVEINTFDAPTPTITGATSFCSGGSTTLGLSDSYQSVSWSTGDSGSSTIVDGTNAGIITVQVTDFSGCTGSSEVSVSEDTELQIAGDSVTVCNDAVSTAVFDAGDANPSFSFVWDAAAMANGAISGTNGGILTTSVAGTYIVTVTDAGCSGAGEFVLEYEEPQVVILTPEADICNNKDLGPGSSVDLTDNASPTGGSWTDDNLVFGGAADFANLQFDGLLAGDYQFTYCVSGVECGDACETIMIKVEDCNCPVAVVGSIDTLCNDMVESINLDNREIPSDAGTWTWNGPDGGMSFINPGAPMSSLEIPVGVIAGDYSIVYTLDGLEAGCGIVADTLDFVINEAQTVTITEQVDVCNMDTGVGQICIDFDTLITAGVTMGDWIPDPQYELDGGDFSNVNNVCFDGLSVNSVYIFTFMGSGAVAPCQPAEGEVRVEVKDCDCKDPSTIALPIVCAKDTTITLSDYITSDTDPGSWSMTNDGTGDILTITMTSSSIIVDDNTAPGTYVFLYENADPNGGTCIEESQQTLTIFEPIFVDLTMSNLEACNAVPTNGGTLSNIVNIEALLTPGSDPSGVWTDNFGLLSGGQSIDNIDFMTMPEIPIGTVIQFTYTVTSPDGDPCPDEFVVVTVSIVDCTLPPCPSLLTDPPSDLCTSGGSVDLTLLENISEPGTWSLGTATNGGVNSTVDLVGGMFTVDENSTAGTYEVAFKLDAPAIDCDSISTQMITVVDPLVVSFNPATACNQPNQTGGALSNIIDLTSYFDGTTTSMIGNWTSTLPSTDLDLSDPTMVDFANLQASSPITITFTTTNGTDPCGQAMGDLMVTVTDCDCPNLVVDPLDPVCNSGATIDLSVESETDDTVDGSWSEQAGNPTTGVLTGDIVTIDGTSSVGLYTFIFTPTIMPNPGCPETSMVTLTVNQAATAGTPSSTVFCDSETGIVILSDLLTGEDSGGTWIETSITPSGGFDATAGTFTVDNEGPNEYLFTYTVAGVNPCLPASEEVMVIIEAEPVADAGLDAELTCEMMSSNLNGLGTSTGDYTYTWTNAAGDLLSESVDSFNLLAITEGTYILTVLDNVTGCSNIDTAIVTSIDGLPTVTVDPCTDMGEGILFINVDGSNLPLTLEITGPSGDVQTVEYNSSTIDQIDGLSPGSYSVTLFDDTGCSTAPVAAVIFSAEDIVNNATDEIDTILQGTLYTLYATDFIVDGLGDYEILWTNETDPLNPVVLCQDPPDDCQEVEILVERIERICLTLTDVNGCVNQDCIDLRFRLENEVFTPNIFNPGDDLDGWVYPITDKEALVTQFTVFDRWGNVIFVRQNFPSNMPELGWDGTYNGVDAEQGVYVYVYSVTFPNDEVVQVAKDVTLTR